MSARRWLGVAAAVSLTVAALTPTTAAAAPNATCPWVGSTAPVPQRVAQVLAQMSQAQKISLLHGAGGAYVGNTPAIPALCIPALGLEDGPAGVGENLNGVTQLPAPVAAAATWNVDAETQYGQLVGSEEAGKGANVNLGPTVNIVRDPRWGRAFESLSEDPYLAGQLGAAEIRGVQGTGVLAQIKHIGVYNQETNRNTPSDNAIVDNRTLQEIYLPQFQAGVQQGAASSAMCSYSTVNGTYACQNPALLNGPLRTQFGFPGFVTSDWGATHSTVASANAGMDQEMPGGDFFGSALQTAVQNGQVTAATLNSMVSRILTEMFAFGLFDNPHAGNTGATVTSAAHKTAARQIAAEGTVLLRNNNVLPVNTTNVHSIAVIGADASTSPQTAGGGSARVNSSGTVTPLQGITSRAGSGVSVQYAAGDTSGNIAQAVTLARNSNLAVVFASYNESEGSDIGTIDLPGVQNSLISQVAAANPNTVVVLNTGSAVTMPWSDSVAGILEAWYPGQEDGNAIASVLFGDTNPSGKLPVSFPKSLNDVPAHTQAQWPGGNGTVQYSEGVQVGYRWYQAQNIAPLYPFGFGLSYTSFAFSNLQITPLDAHGKATVTATVTNTGSRAGSEVAQLYVGDPASTGEPPLQLKGFDKVSLQPGASTTVSFPLTLHDLAYWNNGWTTALGSYRIAVGNTSATPQLSGTLSVTSTNAGNTVTVTNPQGMSSPVGTAVSLPIQATGTGLTFTATGLPAGLTISGDGTISGTATTGGTSTVTVTATDSTGASGDTTFVWTATTGNGGGTGHTGPILAGVGSNLCVDVRSASTNNGTPVQIYACNGSGAQTWTVGSDGTVQALGKCMDVSGAGTANGTKVQLYDCNGTGAQQWQAQNGGLVNPNSGRCLDDPSASTANSTQLQIWDCNGQPQQRWQLPA
ncbi:glycoside hydrolase family 3 C-terminal domain-containing protein [Kutzneria chonburiensis]|uniref:Probable beta-glucosidase G n=1 Tax=Kutzneria chonburiensis TaxID=1483604 RepID=A0ABV6MT65_9PSEU|nr:glycoside hydrolase family 3 C-terminal domain-containing protein [Kutzneria chonburiensis]